MFHQPDDRPEVPNTVTCVDGEWFVILTDDCLRAADEADANNQLAAALAVQVFASA